MKLILASASPRRRDILTEYKYDFEVVPSNVDETMSDKLTPYENSLDVARRKALDVFKKRENDLILASDTIVTLNGVVYGKPKSREDAYSMLKTFSGKTHEVVTSVCLMSKKETKDLYVVSKVTFKELSDDDINFYLDTKEPYDKAGSYAIQGEGKKFISKFDGSINNIIGLPIECFKDILDEMLGA